MEYTIIFQPSGRRGRVPEGTTILDAARRLGVGIEAVCGEQLVCGKCRVKVMEGSFPKENITSSMDHLSDLDEKEIKVLKRKYSETCWSSFRRQAEQASRSSARLRERSKSRSGPLSGNTTPSFRCLPWR